MATPDPTDPPSPFPAWLLAADPRLAAAETNGLYRAFRTRRRARGRGAFAVVARTIIFTASAIGAAAFGYGWWIYGAAVAIGLTRGLVSGFPRRWSRCRLPESLRATLKHPRALHPQAAMDIASIPATAEETLECVYLEHRERQVEAIRDGVAFGAGLAAGIYAEMLDYHLMNPAFLLAPVAAFLFLACCVSRALAGFLGAAYTVLFICRPLARIQASQRNVRPALAYANHAGLLTANAWGAAALVFGFAIFVTQVVTYWKLPYAPAFAPLASGLQVALGMLLVQFFARPGVVSPGLLPLVPPSDSTFPGLSALIVREES